VGWRPEHYIHGDGLRVQSGARSYELVPYVLSGTGGMPAGYALVVDQARSGFVRVPGTLERAVAEAELMILTEK
jgi:hypothetical protein